MVDVKITTLPAAGTLTGAELLPAVQGGANVKLLVSAVRAGLLSTSAPVLTAPNRLRWQNVVGTDFVADIYANDGGVLFVGGAIGVNLRPNGVGSSVGEVRVRNDGAMLFSGSASALADTRSSLGAVGRTGNEDVAGEKNFTTPSRWTLGASGVVQFSTPANIPGIVGRAGDPAGGVESTYRTDVRFGAGFFQLITNIAPSSTAGTKGFQIDTNFFPVENNTMSCGKATNVWANVYTQNAPITGSDKRKKKNIRYMTDSEETAFLEISELKSAWEWEVGDRIHGGPTVQDARDVMLDHGLDPWAYSCFCHDSWPAKEAVWREWPAQSEVWEEWPAQEAIYAVVPATYGGDGEQLTPETHVMVSPAVEAGRRLVSEAVEAGRELVSPAVEAGESFGFRVGELHAWMLAAMARRDRRRCAEAEERMAAIEGRLAALEASR